MVNSYPAMIDAVGVTALSLPAPCVEDRPFELGAEAHAALETVFVKPTEWSVPLTVEVKE